jgi:hypothetical protein
MKLNGIKIKFIFSIDILNSFKGINFVGLEAEDKNPAEANMTEKYKKPIKDLELNIKNWLEPKNNKKVPFYDDFFIKLYEIVDKL